jgi:hypothetical protein
LKTRKIGFPGNLVFKPEGRFEMSFTDMGGIIAGSHQYQQAGETVTLTPDPEPLRLNALNHYPGGDTFVQRILRYARGKSRLLPKKKSHHFEAKIFTPGGSTGPSPSRRTASTLSSREKVWKAARPASRSTRMHSANASATDPDHRPT